MSKFFCDDWDVLEYRQGYFLGLIYVFGIMLGIFLRDVFAKPFLIFLLVFIMVASYYVIPLAWNKFILKKRKD